MPMSRTFCGETRPQETFCGRQCFTGFQRMPNHHIDTRGNADGIQIFDAPIDLFKPIPFLIAFKI